MRSYVPKAFLGSLAVLAMLTTAAHAATTVIVATFEDPVPTKVAAEQGQFAAATGWKIDWRKFSQGSAVIAALASGDVKLAELGSSPFASAVTQGVDIEAFMIDYVIGKSESLIVRNGTGIKTLADLKGKRVGVPIGSTSNFSLIGALVHAGVNPHQVTIMNMSPDEIVAAWHEKEIDAAYIWPPAQSDILQTGTRLVSSTQVAKWGYPTFNVWVVNKKFAKSHAKSLLAFMKVNNSVIESYLNNPAAWTPNSPNVKILSKVTGGQPSQIADILGGYTFLTLKEQLESQWFGGGVTKAVAKTAGFLKSIGRIGDVLNDYSPYVTNIYLKEAAH